MQRRYSETAGALAVSTLFMVLAFWMISDPAGTIGQASRWSNDMSVAFLSVTRNGDLEAGLEGGGAKEEIADELFTTLVHQPWLVLNFGGLAHCPTGEDDRPTPPSAAGGGGCIDHNEKYADRWLQHPVGSPEREAEYKALAEGEVPSSNTNFTDAKGGALQGAASGAAGGPAGVAAGALAGAASADEEQVDYDKQFAGYEVSKADKGAVEIQQAGGGFQRLMMAVLVFLGDLGAVLLLGFLSLVVILAQVLALLVVRVREQRRRPRRPRGGGGGERGMPSNGMRPSRPPGQDTSPAKQQLQQSIDRWRDDGNGAAPTPAPRPKPPDRPKDGRA